MAIVLSRPIVRKFENVTIPGKAGTHTLVVMIDRGRIRYKLGGQRWTSAYELPHGHAYFAAARYQSLQGRPDPATKGKRKFLAKRGKL